MEVDLIHKYIDDGANYYIDILGNASHMEKEANEFYSTIHPKAGEVGVTMLYDIRYDKMSDDNLEEKLREIQNRNISTWWGIYLTEKINKVLLNQVLTRDEKLLNQENEDDCEYYMALLPGKMAEYQNTDTSIVVKSVDNPQNFKIWAEISNQVLSSGFPIMHSENHYHLLPEGKMTCYLGYYEGVPVSTSAIINNNGIATLEFVATKKEYRKKGLGKAVCSKAIMDAFSKEVKIITLRAFPAGLGLYQEIGFRVY